VALVLIGPAVPNFSRVHSPGDIWPIGEEGGEGGGGRSRNARSFSNSTIHQSAPGFVPFFLIPLISFSVCTDREGKE